MATLTKKLMLLGALIIAVFLFIQGVESRKTTEKSRVETAASDDNNLESLKTPQEIESHLKLKLRVPNVTDIEPSPLKGFYQAFIDGNLIYVSNDGKYLLSGNLFDLGQSQPLSLSAEAVAKQEEKQAPIRAKMLASIDESDMVVFKAKNEQHVITVFTDVDCGYCRKLHSEVAQLNALGISVRYLAFPRAGIGSGSHKKLESIWCAKDRVVAMDDAKLRGKFSNGNCAEKLAPQYHLAKEMKISGTPSIILSDGEIIGGYLPAKELVAHLSQKS